jgi:hypothetical protein
MPDQTHNIDNPPPSITETTPTPNITLSDLNPDKVIALLSPHESPVTQSQWDSASGDPIKTAQYKEADDTAYAQHQANRTEMCRLLVSHPETARQISDAINQQVAELKTQAESIQPELLNENSTEARQEILVRLNALNEQVNNLTYTSGIVFGFALAGSVEQ